MGRSTSTEGGVHQWGRGTSLEGGVHIWGRGHQWGERYINGGERYINGGGVHQLVEGYIGEGRGTSMG